MKFKRITAFILSFLMIFNLLCISPALAEDVETGYEDIYAAGGQVDFDISSPEDISPITEEITSPAVDVTGEDTSTSTVEENIPAGGEPFDNPEENKDEIKDENNPDEPEPSAVPEEEPAEENEEVSAAEFIFEGGYIVLTKDAFLYPGLYTFEAERYLPQGSTLYAPVFEKLDEWGNGRYYVNFIATDEQGQNFIDAGYIQSSDGVIVGGENVNTLVYSLSQTPGVLYFNGDYSLPLPFAAPVYVNPPEPAGDEIQKDIADENDTINNDDTPAPPEEDIREDILDEVELTPPEEVENLELSVSVFPESVNLGDTISFFANVTGNVPDGAVWQWQISPDGINWHDIQGENKAEYTTVANTVIFLNYIRVTLVMPKGPEQITEPQELVDTPDPDPLDEAPMDLPQEEEPSPPPDTVPADGQEGAGFLNPLMRPFRLRTADYGGDDVVGGIITDNNNNIDNSGDDTTVVSSGAVRPFLLANANPREIFFNPIPEPRYDSAGTIVLAAGDDGDAEHPNDGTNPTRPLLTIGKVLECINGNENITHLRIMNNYEVGENLVFNPDRPITITGYNDTLNPSGSHTGTFFTVLQNVSLTLGNVTIERADLSLSGIKVELDEGAKLHLYNTAIFESTRIFFNFPSEQSFPIVMEAGNVQEYIVGWNENIAGELVGICQGNYTGQFSVLAANTIAADQWAVIEQNNGGDQSYTYGSFKPVYAAVYVDGVNGRDSNPGNKPEVPVKTYNEALRLLTAANNTGDTGDKVTVQPGVTVDTIYVLNTIPVTEDINLAPEYKFERYTKDTDKTHPNTASILSVNGDFTISARIIDKSTAECAATIVHTGGTLNLRDVTIEGNEYNAHALESTAGSVNIINSTLSGKGGVYIGQQVGAFNIEDSHIKTNCNVDMPGPEAAKYDHRQLLTVAAYQEYINNAALYLLGGSGFVTGGSLEGANRYSSVLSAHAGATVTVKGTLLKGPYTYSSYSEINSAHEGTHVFATGNARVTLNSIGADASDRGGFPGCICSVTCMDGAYAEVNGSRVYTAEVESAAAGLALTGYTTVHRINLNAPASHATTDGTLGFYDLEGKKDDKQVTERGEIELKGQDSYGVLTGEIQEDRPLQMGFLAGSGNTVKDGYVLVRPGGGLGHVDEQYKKVTLPENPYVIVQPGNENSETERNNVVIRVEGVFVSTDDIGDDNNDGLSPITPVRTFKKAQEVLDKQIKINPSFKSWIYIVGENGATISGNDSVSFSYDPSNDVMRNGISSYNQDVETMITVPAGASFEAYNVRFDGEYNSNGTHHRAKTLISSAGTFTATGCMFTDAQKNLLEISGGEARLTRCGLFGFTPGTPDKPVNVHEKNIDNVENGIYISGGNVILDGVNVGFTTRTAPAWAGIGIQKYGIYVGDGGECTMSGSHVRFCGTRDSSGLHPGGGVYLAGRLRMTDSTIEDNVGYQGGGVEMIGGGTLDVVGNTHAEIIQNNSAYFGGGIYIDCHKDIEDHFCRLDSKIQISHNTAEKRIGDENSGFGGGIYFYCQHGALIDNAQVSGNNAHTAGGGIYIAHGTVAINGDSMENNTVGSADVPGEGSSVYIATDGKLFHYGTTIKGNVYNYGTYVMNACGDSSRVLGGIYMMNGDKPLELCSGGSSADGVLRIFYDTKSDDNPITLPVTSAPDDSGDDGRIKLYTANSFLGKIIVKGFGDKEDKKDNDIVASLNNFRVIGIDAFDSDSQGHEDVYPHIKASTGNDVYWDPAQNYKGPDGTDLNAINDQNDGSTAQKAVLTFDRAIELLATKNEESRIIMVSKFMVPQTGWAFDGAMPAGANRKSNALIIRGYDGNDVPLTTAMFYSEYGGELRLEKMTISGVNENDDITGKTTITQAPVYVINSSLVLTNIKIEKNHVQGQSSSSSGGGIYFNSGNTNVPAFIMDNVTVSECSSFYSGGGMYIETSRNNNNKTWDTWSWKDLKVLNNSTSNGGGGIYIKGGLPKVDYTDGEILIDNNLAKSDGGGLLLLNGYYRIDENYKIINNHIKGETTSSSNKRGAGINVANSGTTLHLIGAEIADNIIENGAGGGIYGNHADKIIIEGANIHGNKIGLNSNSSNYTYGGGLSSWECKEVQIKGSNFYENESDFGAAMVFENKSDSIVKIENVEVENNIGNLSGAVHISGGKTSVLNSRIFNNYSINNPSKQPNSFDSHKGWYGGGLCIRYGTHTIEGSTINGNRTNTYGGGIMSFNANITVKDCEISANTAQYAGGGVYCRGGNLTIQGGDISGNTAGTTFSVDGNKNISEADGYGVGGGICRDTFGGSSRLYGVKISGNKALKTGSKEGVGGGISLVYGGFATDDKADTGSNTSVTIDSCNITGNTAQNGGGIASYIKGAVGSGNTINITRTEINNNTAAGSVTSADLNAMDKINGGGGLYISKPEGPSVYISGGSISENHADSGAGGGILSKGSLRITGNCAIQDNSAAYGGGIFNSKKLSNYRNVDIPLTLNSGVISGNSSTGDNNFSSGIFNNNPLYMAGSSVGIKDRIYLENTAYPVTLTAPLRKGSMYNIAFNSDNFNYGDIVMRPNIGGAYPDNAAQYMMYVKPVQEGYVFGKGDYTGEPEYTGKSKNAIAIYKTIFVDGETGNDKNTGTEPNSAFKTMERALSEAASAAGQNVIIFVSGKTQATGTWSCGNNKKVEIRRYTVAAIGGTTTYPPYYGDMFEVEGTLDIGSGIAGIYGSNSSEDLTSVNGPIFTIPQGATLNINSDVILGGNHNLEGNGGAIANSGTVNVKSGIKAQIQNCDADRGAGIYNLGTVNINGQLTFMGNYAEKGSSVYQGGNFYLKNDSTLNSVDSDIHLAEQKVLTVGSGVTLSNKLPLTIADPQDGRVYVQYSAPGMTGSTERPRYKLPAAISSTFSLMNRTDTNNHLQLYLQMKNVVYVDQTFDKTLYTKPDPNDEVVQGKTADYPFATLEEAYAYLNDNEGGLIYLVKPYEIKADTTVSASTEDGHSVAIKRYSRPENFASLHPDHQYKNYFHSQSNLGSLFIVKKGATLTLDGIAVDGHAHPVASAKEGNEYVIAPGVTAIKSAIHVDEGAYLKLINGAGITSCAAPKADGDSIVTSHSGGQADKSLSISNTTDRESEIDGRIFLGYEQHIKIDSADNRLHTVKHLQLRLNDPRQGRIIVHYKDPIAEAAERNGEINKYRLSEEILARYYMVFHENNQDIILKMRGEVYVSGTTGDDTRTYSTPDKPFKTLGRCYEYLGDHLNDANESVEGYGGTIYVVGQVDIPQGMHVNLYKRYYSNSNGTSVEVSHGDVRITRYSKWARKDGEPAKYKADSYTGAMIYVPENTTLTIDGVEVNGHRNSDKYYINYHPEDGTDIVTGATVTADGITARNTAILVNGNLNLTNGARIIDNSNGNNAGGAIRVSQGGSVEMDSAVIENNSGSSVYNNGIYFWGKELSVANDMQIGNDQWIYLLVDKDKPDDKKVKVTQEITGKKIPIELPEDGYEDGRVIATYADNLIPRIEDFVLKDQTGQMTKKNLTLKIIGKDLVLKKNIFTHDYGEITLHATANPTSDTPQTQTVNLLYEDHPKDLLDLIKGKSFTMEIGDYSIDEVKYIYTPINYVTAADLQTAKTTAGYDTANSTFALTVKANGESVKTISRPKENGENCATVSFPDAIGEAKLTLAIDNYNAITRSGSYLIPVKLKSDLGDEISFSFRIRIQLHPTPISATVPLAIVVKSDIKGTSISAPTNYAISNGSPMRIRLTGAEVYAGDKLEKAENIGDKDEDKFAITFKSFGDLSVGNSFNPIGSIKISPLSFVTKPDETMGVHFATIHYTFSIPKEDLHEK